MINVQLLGIMSSASVLGGPRPAVAGREGGTEGGLWRGGGDVTPRGSPLGTSPKEAPVPPRLCEDGGIACSPTHTPIATPKPWVHAGRAVGANPPNCPLLPGVPRPTGSLPTQERSKLPLFPTAHPARWPGSQVWSSQRGCHDEGRMKAGIPSASSPGESRAGAAALQQRAPSGDAGVPGGEGRDPLCHPHSLIRAKVRESLGTCS